VSNLGVPEHGDPTRGGDLASEDGAGDGEEVEEVLRRGKEGWLEPRSVAEMHVYMKGNGLEKPTIQPDRKQGLVVTVLAVLPKDGVKGKGKGYRIAWKTTGYYEWQLRAERVFDITEIEGGETRTEVVCWETFGGVLAPVVKLTAGKTLVERFGDYFAGLKTEAEKGKQVEV
jgi:hypothetical protein